MILITTYLQFRVALLLSENEAIISEQSVIISTLAQGIPMSKPIIVRCLAVDQTRISISWEPGAFVNGPILSYALLIKDLIPTGYFAIKVKQSITNIPLLSTAIVSKAYLFIFLFQIPFI